MRKTSAVILFDLSVEETMSTDVGTALNCVPSGKIKIIIVQKKKKEHKFHNKRWPG